LALAAWGSPAEVGCLKMQRSLDALVIRAWDSRCRMSAVRFHVNRRV